MGRCVDRRGCSVMTAGARVGRVGCPCRGCRPDERQGGRRRGEHKIVAIERQRALKYVMRCTVMVAVPVLTEANDGSRG